jgi:hypothetical protein
MAREFEVKTRLTAEDQASPTIEKASKSLDDLDKAAVSAEAGLGTATAAVFATVAALKQLISASAEQEDALKRLDSALQLKGASEFGTALRAQADELQRTSRFSDDAVNSAQALIATYGVAADQLELATQAAADLSARLGIDLQTAAAQVAGTINGFTRGVDRVVPALKGMSDESLRAGDGIRAIAAAMSGGAADAATTLAGQYDRLSNAFGELIEKSGDWLVQNDFVRNGMEGLVLAVQDLGGAMTKGGRAIKDYGDAFAQLVTEQEASLRTVTALAEIQDRSTRILSENATQMSRAAQLAAQYGITLQSTVNVAEQQRIRDLAELDALLRLTGDSMARNTNELNGTAQAARNAAQAYDQLARSMIPVNAGGLTLAQQIDFGGPLVISGFQPGSAGFVNGGRFGDRNLNGTPRRF